MITSTPTGVPVDSVTPPAGPTSTRTVICSGPVPTRRPRRVASPTEEREVRCSRVFTPLRRSRSGLVAPPQWVSEEKNGWVWSRKTVKGRLLDGTTKGRLLDGTTRKLLHPLNRVYGEGDGDGRPMAS